MARSKTRWNLEVDDGLLASLEDAHDDQKKSESGLNRNEFLCRLLRRSLSHNVPVCAVSFTTAAPQTMAEFRGDVEKLERLFGYIRAAIVNRNRGVDRTDAESVARFKADEDATRQFKSECKAVLTIARDRAWTLRGFSDEQISQARRFLETDLRERLEWAEKRVAELTQQLARDPADTIPKVDDEKNLLRLSLGIQRVNALQCALSLLTLGEVLAPTVTQTQTVEPPNTSPPPPTKSVGSGLGNLELEDY